LAPASYVSNNASGTTAVIGADPSSGGSGNKVSDNALDGIDASGNVQVIGNVVSGASGGNDYGINLIDATASDNVVYNNTIGILEEGSGTIQNNRVYHNSGAGIIAEQSQAALLGNVVYSNLLGIQMHESSGQLTNNLIYANVNQGVLIEQSNSGVNFDNNTVYQTTGDAVDVSSSINIQLRDNILWVFTGYGISVTSDSQQGFASDYNDLMTSGTGQVALWQGVVRSNLRAWQSADFTDQNSLSQDPLFVDPASADGIIGYSTATSDGRDDDFHEQSLYGSFHGGSLAPVISTTTGFAVFPTATLTDDAHQSPVIDRGGPNDPYQNEPAPNGNYVNLGAYGNTAQASLSPQQYVTVMTPSGGESWPQGQTFNITWRTQDQKSGSSATFQIDLMQVGNSTPVLTIASGLANTGSYAWTVPAGLTPANDYVIRVTREDGSGLFGVSNPFAIAGRIHDYYVNGPNVTAGGYTTAPGSDSNDGLTPATPMASIQDVLNTYHLNPGDTILVDAGTYDLGSNLVLAAAQSGIIIQGYTNPNNPGLTTVLNRGNTNSGSYVIELSGATNVTLSNLQLTGGEYGFYPDTSSNSSGLTVSHCTLFDNSQEGALINSGNDNATFVNNTIYAEGTGIEADSNAAVVTGNIVHDTSSTGLSLGGTNAQVSGNQVYGNNLGIVVAGSGSTVQSNRVFDNTVGIDATNGDTVSANTVYGQTSDGIDMMGGSTALGNVVYDNGTGIRVQGGVVEANRVYGNSGAGISGSEGQASIVGNHVYGNAVGVDLGSSYSGTVSQNVLEGNATAGIHDGNNQGVELDNNTIDQETGNAIQVDGAAVNAHVENNILWSQSGYDIAVAADSQQGFQSDYNDLYTTGSGNLGQWQGQTFSNLSDWFYELGFDGHSLTTNPQFVNPAGADGVVGYSTAAVGNPVVLDDSTSGFSTSGTWTQQTDGGYQGEYWTSPAGSGEDSATWTFSGLTAGATYQVAVIWPVLSSTSFSNATNAPFTVLDGSRVLSYERLDQESAPNSDVTVNNTPYQALGYVQVSGTTLTVQLSNDANGIVEADAVLLQRVVGDHDADDNFQLQPNSPAVAAGNPDSPYFQEASPNADRSDQGAYGNTPLATATPSQVVQVLCQPGRRSTSSANRLPSLDKQMA
jgi:parallel beta-helix repeat protein